MNSKKMLSYVLFSTVLVLCGCSNGKNNKEELTMIAPTGTPLLGLSTYLKENDNASCEVVSGSDPLLAAFTQASKDIIVAPVNLGANMFAKTGNYVLFETFVWGNLYVASNNPINSFQDLQDKTIAIFGTNQTPDIIMQTLAAENNVTYEKELTESVTSSQTLFMSGQVDYFVAAEPSLSKIRLQQTIYTLDLQDEWEKITGSSSYPQAGIFVKKDQVTRLKKELIKMRDEVKDILLDVDYTADCALEQSSFQALGKDVIKESLPNCHFGIDENQKDAIEYYYHKLESLSLESTMGGVVPSEEFYLSL